MACVIVYSISKEKFSTTWDLSTDMLLQAVTILNLNLETKNKAKTPSGSFFIIGYHVTTSTALQTVQTANYFLMTDISISKKKFLKNIKTSKR